MRIRIFLVFLLPLLFLLLMVMIVLRFIRKRKRSRMADSAAEGTITRVQHKQIAKNAYNFTVFVRYEAEGKYYQTKFTPYAEVTPDCSFKEGDRVTVHYLAGYPAEGFVHCDNPFNTAFVCTVVCTVILLFISLLMTDTLVQYDFGWFTLPERRLIGAIRLGGLTLLFLGFVALTVWLAMSRRRSLLLTGTVREIKQLGNQSVLCTECVIDGEQRILRLPAGPSSKQEYAVGDSIRFRYSGDLCFVSIEKAPDKKENIRNLLAALAAAAGFIVMLIEELQKLLKL